MKRSLLIILVIVFAVSMVLFSFSCKPAGGAKAAEETTAAAGKNVADLHCLRS